MQTMISKPLAALMLCAILALPAAAIADPVMDAAERQARLQAQGLPGEISIRLGALDPNTRLPPCTSLQGYAPPGARPWGKTHVGVRCLGPNPWNILVPVEIAANGNYVVTARALTAGQPIGVGDVAVMRGDLASLPAGVITEAAAVTGKTLRNSLSAGQPLRADLLLAPILVRQGQTVRLISRGPGFTAASEGKAVNNAAEGQVAQVRVPSGQIISGIVQADGSVEVGR